MIDKLSDKDHRRLERWLGEPHHGKVERCWFWELVDTSNGLGAGKLATQQLLEVKGHANQRTLYAVTAEGLRVLGVTCAACGRSESNPHVDGVCPGAKKVAA